MKMEDWTEKWEGKVSWKERGEKGGFYALDFKQRGNGCVIFFPLLLGLFLKLNSQG